MQFSSLERLQHLGNVRHAKAAAARDASDRASDLRARLQRLEARRRHLHEVYHPRDAQDRLEQIEREIEGLRSELADADARRNAAGEAFQAAGACHDSARRYAAEQGLPMPSDDAAQMNERRGLTPEEGAQ